MSLDGLLAAGILQELSGVPAPGVTSLPRLSKRLGVEASVLLRALGQMGDDLIGGQPGPGWVRVERTTERWMVQLTARGQAALAALAQQA